MHAVAGEWEPNGGDNCGEPETQSLEARRRSGLLWSENCRRRENNATRQGTQFDEDVNAVLEGIARAVSQTPRA